VGSKRTSRIPNYKSRSGVEKVLRTVEELLKLQSLSLYNRDKLQEWKKVISKLDLRINYNNNFLGIPWLGEDFIMDHADLLLQDSPNNLILFVKEDVKDNSFKLDLHSCDDNKRVTGNFIT
jgi:hypothetical protein